MEEKGVGWTDGPVDLIVALSDKFQQQDKEVLGIRIVALDEPTHC
jgi:hypothetical protein